MEPRTQLLPDFHLTDPQWNALQIPIGLAFIYSSTRIKQPVAIYPSPAGATESQLDPELWMQLVAENPGISDLAPDVEALLVNRTHGAREYYRVSIDRCYALIGVIRTHWHGLSGGTEAWNAIAEFFRALNVEAGVTGGVMHA